MEEPTEQTQQGFRVLRAIRRIIRRVSTHSRALSREAGLTLPQLVCMRAIRDAGTEVDGPDEITVAWLSARVHLSPSTVSGVIDRLVRAGMVNRDRSERDRRRVHVTLTPSGEASLDDVPNPLQDRFLARLAALPGDEREALIHALERVVELMEAEAMDAAPMLVPGDELPVGK